MKKFLSLILSALLMLSLFAFASAEGTTVTIESLNGSREAIDLEVPFAPQRIAILDMAPRHS